MEEGEENPLSSHLPSQAYSKCLLEAQLYIRQIWDVNWQAQELIRSPSRMHDQTHLNSLAGLLGLFLLSKSVALCSTAGHLLGGERGGLQPVKWGHGQVQSSNKGVCALLVREGQAQNYFLAKSNGFIFTLLLLLPT